MKLRPVGLLVGAAVATTAACGGSPAPKLANQTIQAPAQSDVAEQGHQASIRQANAKAVQDAIDAKVAQDAVDAKAAQDAADAKAAAAVKVTPKATPKAIPKQPDCAAAAMKRGKFDPNCSAYQGYLDPGTSAGRPPTSGEIQLQNGCDKGYISLAECDAAGYPHRDPAAPARTPTAPCVPGATGDALAACLGDS